MKPTRKPSPISSASACRNPTRTKSCTTTRRPCSGSSIEEIAGNFAILPGYVGPLKQRLELLKPPVELQRKQGVTEYCKELLAADLLQNQPDALQCSTPDCAL